MKIEIELTEIQYKAFEVLASNPTEWIQNAGQVRADAEIERIIKETVAECLSKNVEIPSTKDGIFNLAFDLGIARNMKDIESDEAIDTMGNTNTNEE